VIGFDDAPFGSARRKDCRTYDESAVLVVGAVYSGSRLVGVLSGRVHRDGSDATAVIVHVVRSSQFAAQTQAILLQGIAVAGFNVMDIHGMHASLGMPVLVIARRQPDIQAIREALLHRVEGGAEKWALIERAGPMEAVGGVFVQRAGLSLPEAEGLIRKFAVNGAIPEPLRTAHLIAGGIATGQSRGRT